MLMIQIMASLQIKKEGFLKMRLLYLLVFMAVYTISGCYSAVVSALISMVRDLYLLKRKKNSKVILFGYIILSTGLNLFIALRTYSGFTSLLPVCSFLFYTIGMMIAKNSTQMKITAALDMGLFWIVHDLKNMLIICVITDLYLILSPLAVKYIERDKEYYAEDAEEAQATC